MTEDYPIPGHNDPVHMTNQEIDEMAFRVLLDRARRSMADFEESSGDPPPSACREWLRIRQQFEMFRAIKALQRIG